MMYKILFSVILVSLLPACQSADEQQSQPPGTVLPASAHIAAPAPDVLKTDKDATVIKKKILDTRITPEMVKDIRFDLNTEPVNDEADLPPLMINPSNKNQIMITPRLFLDESDRAKEDYIDYIDGAAIQLEVKFD